MKKILRCMLVVASLVSFTLAHAEVFTWVDKDGKKHFGDKIPSEYAVESKTVDVKKPNAMDATPINTQAFRDPEQPKPVQKRPKPAAILEPETTGLSQCEIAKREYERSVACFAGCRRFKNYTYGESNVDLSNCGDCKDAKKPSC